MGGACIDGCNELIAGPGLSGKGEVMRWVHQSLIFVRAGSSSCRGRDGSLPGRQGERERWEREQRVERGSSILADILFSQSLLRSRVYHPWKSQIPGAQEEVWESNGSSQDSQGLCVKHGPEHLLQKSQEGWVRGEG